MICLQNFLAICLLITSAIAVEFQFLNRCNAQLWVGIQGNAGKSPLSNGGFAIKKGQRVSINFFLHKLSYSPICKLLYTNHQFVHL